MNPTELKQGVVMVKNKPNNDGISIEPFMLSCVVSVGCVRGIAAFEIGGKPPRKGKHTLIDWQSEQWLNRLEAA